MKKTKQKEEQPLIGPNSTITIKISAKKAATARQQAVKTLAKNVKLSGFRAGKVPAQLAQAHLKTEAIINESLRIVIPKLYEEAIQKEKKTPITQPQISIVSAEPGKEWVVEAAFAEKPQISIAKYKSIVKKALKEFASQQKKSAKRTKDSDNANDQQPSIEDQKLLAVYQALVQELKPQIPELLLKQEVEYDLQMLQYRLRVMNKTLQDYLQETGQEYEAFTTHMAASVLGRLQLQYILDEIVQKESIGVTEKELAAKKPQKPEETEHVRQTLLREKLTTFLLSL